MPQGLQSFLNTAQAIVLSDRLWGNQRPRVHEPIFQATPTVDNHAQRTWFVNGSSNLGPIK